MLLGIRRIVEPLLWLGALLYLALLDTSQTHFSICVFNYLGLDYCPGCGLGHSISKLLQGHFHESLATHPLGLFAVLVLFEEGIVLKFYRAYQVSRWEKGASPSLQVPLSYWKGGVNYKPMR